MPHNNRIFSGQIVLVLGHTEGFPEWLIDQLSQAAGFSAASPEEFLIKLEEALESGDLTLSDIHDMLVDMQSRAGDRNRGR